MVSWLDAIDVDAVSAEVQRFLDAFSGSSLPFGVGVLQDDADA